MAERPDELRVPAGEETQELHVRSRSDDEVETARADVEQTRAEMSETVDALQEKMDPDRLKEDAKAQAEDKVRDTGSQILDSVKENPAVPAAIVGSVIGLFLLRRLVRGGGRSGGERVETVVLDLRDRSMRTS